MAAHRERVHYERAEAIQDTIRRNSNLVLGLEEYVVRIMKSVDQTIRLVKHRYERHGSRMQISNVMPDGQLTDAFIATFAVLDERGHVLLGKSDSAPMSEADREYFKVHQQHDSGQLFIGAPVKGGLSGNWFIPVSRRINKPDKSFQGVAMVGIDVAYFMSFYPRVNVGHDGMILSPALTAVHVLCVKARRTASAIHRESRPRSPRCPPAAVMMCKCMVFSMECFATSVIEPWWSIRS